MDLINSDKLEKTDLQSHRGADISRNREGFTTLINKAPASHDEMHKGAFFNFFSWHPMNEFK